MLQCDVLSVMASVANMVQTKEGGCVKQPPEHAGAVGVGSAECISIDAWCLSVCYQFLACNTARIFGVKM